MTLTPGESCVRQTELVNPLDIIVHCNAKPLEFNYAHCWARTNFQCGATGSLRTVQSLMYIIGGKQGLPAVFPIRSKGKLVLDSNLADRCAELNFLISGWIFLNTFHTLFSSDLPVTGTKYFKNKLINNEYQTHMQAIRIHQTFANTELSHISS